MQEDEKDGMPATVEANFMLSKDHTIDAIMPCAFCGGAMEIPVGFPNDYVGHDIQMWHVDKAICATVLRERCEGMTRELAIYRRLFGQGFGEPTDAN